MDPDHPRIRGEHPGAPLRMPESSGSSPHTRGARECGETDVSGTGIIPAYAGSTDATYPFGLWYPDHPRIRGEHVEGPGVEFSGDGSSPHTRGARRGDGVLLPARWIIPAYAGSTIPPRSQAIRPADHPRIRGEHRLAVHGEIPGAGSSPHTRGAHQNQCDSRHEAGIIPAYAGSTCKSRGRSSSWSDHPRIRGEHWPPPPPVCGPPGSSPHTRGAHPIVLRHGDRFGIIPAYAGSTWPPIGSI